MIIKHILSKLKRIATEDNKKCPSKQVVIIKQPDGTYKEV